MAHDRVVNSTLSEFEEPNRSPIDGYQDLPLLTLEEATEKIISLVPGIVDYVSTAKKKCNRSSTLLTWNESAAIYLYSMPITFFSRLNEALRAENRHELKPWFAFLKLFVTALKKLPSIRETVWRGVEGDVGSIFAEGYVQIWWSINSCSMDLKVVEQYLGETGTVFAIDTIHGKSISAFSVFPNEQEIVLMPSTTVSAKCQPLNFKSRFFLIHLTEEHQQSESKTESSYLFERIKQEYQRYSRIDRIINPSKSFPIEQSYINLAIVETKEQKAKEKKLLNTKLSNEIIDTFEEIYGTKTRIEIKDILEKCKDQTKNILILGRAGIGKTTFCRYITYHWAKGEIWRQYQLVVLIQLRLLTTARYPSGYSYSPIDLVRKEYFPFDCFLKDDVRHFKEMCDKGQVLWILDGYDEFVQDMPEHLQDVFNHILRTQHHILTSRPYLIALPYDVEMEIIGFTDDNIQKYVRQFFNQIKDEIDNASLQAQKLLSFIKSNPRIWGIVHIPVNLELICSIWCNNDWSDATMMTITNVYDKMAEWLCQRYIKKQNSAVSQMRKKAVYKRCHNELALLETLAFHGMQQNTVILRPKLLEKAESETGYSIDDHPQLLNIGILKSFEDRPLGTCIEAEKSHYFLHLSFQEHFAARYLVRALNGAAAQEQKTIDFIKNNKYNQRFELVFAFASGLLNDCSGKQCMKLFWETLLGEPFDLIGLRHVMIVISCLEETVCNTTIPQYRQLLNLIIKWINYSISPEHNYRDHHLSVLLRRSPSLVNQPEIIDTFAKLYKDNDPSIRKCASSFISDLLISNPYLDVTRLHLTVLNDNNVNITRSAYEALATMNEKAASNEVTNRLIILLDDTNDDIRKNTAKAIGEMGEKATSNKVTNRLIFLLGDVNDGVRKSAAKALSKMGEIAASNKVINRLITLLGDQDYNIRRSAYEILGKMGEKAATNQVINRLIILLDDTNDGVRRNAYEALGKMGQKVINHKVINGLLIRLRDTDYSVRWSACATLEKMGEKAATEEVINRLIVLLGDTNEHVRRMAYGALWKMGEKAASNDVINRLFTLLSDTNDGVRRSACEAVGKMGEKAATNEVINRLIILLSDTNDGVRRSAYEALGTMGEKGTSDEVIDRFIILVDNTNVRVRKSACEALGKMGEKIASHEVITRLIILLGDANGSVRRSAYEALRKMGKKAATNELIGMLIDVCKRNDGQWRYELTLVMEKILDLLPCMSDLKDDTVRKLSIYIQESDGWFLKNISAEKSIRVFFKSKILFWLPIIRNVSIMQGNAITITGMTITIHGAKESVELSFPNTDTRQQLHDYFVNWMEKSLQKRERTVEEITTMENA